MNGEQRNPNGSPPPQLQEVEVAITEEVTLRGVSVGAVPVDGGHVLEIVDPHHARVTRIPMPSEVGRELGRVLLSGLAIAGAHEVPPPPRGRRG